MDKILYITDIHPNVKSGAGALGKAHNRIIREIGGECVYTIYICEEEIHNNENQLQIFPRSFCEKIQAVLRGYTPRLCTRIVKAILRIIKEKNFSIIYIDNSLSGNLIKNIKHNFPYIKVIAFFYDIETVKMKEEKGHSFFTKCILPVYFLNEKQTVRYADKKIVLNQRDANLYYDVFKKHPDSIAPICIDFLNEDGNNDNCYHIEGQKLNLLFVGVDYGPNVSGLRWFIKEVLPNIRENCLLNIVGYKMEKYREDFEGGNDNVRVIGTVDSLEPYYRDADVVIGPIFEGGGMKVKTAEAFLHGKKYIGTTESLEGYWEDIPEEYKNSHVYKCDSSQDFSKIIEELWMKTFPKSMAEIKVWASGKYTKGPIKEIYKSVFESL